MSIVEKVNDEELALYEVLRHPVFCCEFLRELDDEEDWEYTQYQQEMLCDYAPRVSFCTARTVGKTTVLEDIVIRHAINQFFDSLLFTTPNKVHIDPVFFRITRFIRFNSFLKHFIASKSINFQTSTIKFLNGFLFEGRIAGTSGGGANVVGLHKPLVFIDEAGYYPWGTWIELSPVLNTWETGHQIIVSGVPTGVRSGNVLWYVDKIDEIFTKHNISAHQNPRYSEADDKRNIKQFGGRDSDDYRHLVLGEHGTPSHALFDRERMQIQDYLYPIVRIWRTEYRDDYGAILSRLSSLPRIPAFAEMRAIGIDIGFGGGEPTVIITLYKAGGKWKLASRIILHQIKSPIQRQVIEFVFRHYNPDFIAIDMTGGGKTFYQELKDMSVDWGDVLVPIDFNKTVVIGYDDADKELKVRVKRLAMQQLIQDINGHEIIMPDDEEVISELERTISIRGASGESMYRTLTPLGSLRGADHNMVALSCFSMGWYYKTSDEFGIGKKPPLRMLISPRWMKPDRKERIDYVF